MSFYRDYNDKLAFERWNTRERAAYETIKVTSISPALGAEVEGVDLRHELTSRQLDEIRRASAEYLVLVFRDQAITTADHKRFAHHFGELHRHFRAVRQAAEADPEVLSWKTTAGSRFTAGEAWHNDVSCEAAPISGSLLHVTRLPENGGGDTAFANMYLAYESLSDPLKQLLDGLTAVHSGQEGWTNGYGDEPDPGGKFASSEHPVVVRHPVTGRKFLFINSAFTSHIVQVTRSESDALLQLLYRHIERNLSFQVRVRWTPDALVFWDNWAVQHQAVWDYYPFERWGERVSVVGGHTPVAA
ncbi:MAG: TauD/TfdA family dioxygenase [Aromatoleum sp.]|jgi:taurine dioxygenase|uniref:TauD/TfdA dioxygenase family protein n=1 Tax=Aromatoleum sp. TaxID=2307007 RepID=UPI002895B809|nr:TauD/TfdA family dioxygenase [Aromatoleum sp.]MDT3670351.1 TauD/TfdA family dioxygenase [Aromatoleum sp.]